MCQEKSGKSHIETEGVAKEESGTDRLDCPEGEGERGRVGQTNQEDSAERNASWIHEHLSSPIAIQAVYRMPSSKTEFARGPSIYTQLALETNQRTVRK